MIHITHGNKKLPKTTLNFSLPPITSCPNSTEKCRKHCYAMKSWIQFPIVKEVWTENAEETRKATFVKKVTKHLSTKRTWKQFRIHVAGDFYDQAYFEKWVKITKKFPEKIFYAYTKNHTLNFENKPDNMIMLYSYDDRIKDPNFIKSVKKNGFDGIAQVREHDYKPKEGETICSGDCKTCDKCYVKSKDMKRVIFIKH